MKHILFFLFLFLSIPVFSQVETRHHMGFSIGADPLSAIRVMLESIGDDDYDPNEDYYTDEDDFGAVVLAAYYKYKPLPKWDFDAGVKMGAISYGALEYTHSDINAKMDLGFNIGFFTAVNFSTQNPFSRLSNNPFFSSLEIGWTSPPGDLEIHNRVSNETEVIDNLDGSIYFEGKAGMKFGWENNAVGLFLAVNNMTNTRSADKELRNRGYGDLPKIGVGILIGITYEFGFRKNEKRKNSKKDTTYPDWFKPEE
jgi:hypothetical protein